MGHCEILEAELEDCWPDPARLFCVLLGDGGVALDGFMPSCGIPRGSGFC